jgi:hypothetical protein
MKPELSTIRQDGRSPLRIPDFKRLTPLFNPRFIMVADNRDGGDSSLFFVSSFPGIA